MHGCYVCMCRYVCIYLLCMCMYVCIKYVYLGVFDNRVLRIFGPTTDEITGWWRKLHNEELNDIYCSSNITR